jgi:hypothetical protein
MRKHRDSYLLETRRERNIRENRKQCPYCTKHYQSQNDLDRHIRLIHGKQPGGQPG